MLASNFIFIIVTRVTFTFYHGVMHVKISAQSQEETFAVVLSFKVGWTESPCPEEKDLHNTSTVFWRSAEA